MKSVRRFLPYFAAFFDPVRHVFYQIALVSNERTVFFVYFVLIRPSKKAAEEPDGSAAASWSFPYLLRIVIRREFVYYLRKWIRYWLGVTPTYFLKVVLK